MSLTPEEMYQWWNSAAKENAMTAVLSNDADWDETAFFKTGETSLDEFRAFASLSNVRLGGEIALDFGCGLGRVTQALTKHYRRAIGIDISSEMVRLARQHAGPAPVEYIQALQPPLPLTDRSVDLALSAIVIQHIPAPYNRQVVSELFRVSRQAVLFDAPSHKLRSEDPDPADGIFFLKIDDVITLAHEHDFELVALRYITATTTRHYQYLFMNA